MEHFPIIDAHIHLWDLGKLTYPWLNTLPEINRDFFIKDYDKAIVGHPVEKVIFVQAECLSSQFRDEVSWVSAIADKDPKISAIIPWAPLHTGSVVAEVLEEFTNNPKIKGVRQIIQSEADPHFCLRPDFVEGVRLLGKNNLHFELTIAPEHFPAVLELVERCPETRFILDHIGNPNIAKSELEPWKAYLKAFADSGPHYCKFSNLVCNADLNHWTLNDLKPYSESVIEIFGPERLIWGSDWPHALRASSWTRWFNTAMELTKKLGQDEREAIFRTNAIDFYKL